MSEKTPAAEDTPLLKAWHEKLIHYAHLAAGTVEQFGEARIWVMDNCTAAGNELRYYPKQDGRISMELGFRGMTIPLFDLPEWHPFRLLVEAFTLNTQQIICNMVDAKLDWEKSHKLILYHAIRLGNIAWVKHMLFVNVFHVVQEGDTLSQLAIKYCTTVGTLMQLNPVIKDPNLIYTGSKLRVRP